ncbi:signal peptide, CUB and EGF-like domain-containing protein 1 [Stylophora pistillata]|uniref:signal peptide, CUB and EGF-like domain-containing protein 1 n=1 Tax=Stylophora pistillata TaxID=50429 RepID=UPI000C0465F3|nr:signal peptide, CUB and EGF-like domain-containing protein 1 [Stylophora pistillata]
MEDRCKSINMGPSGEKDKVLCQLSDSDHLQNPYDLKPMVGFMYRGTENKCCFNMCYNNATCLVGFTDKGYKCACPPGYTGDHCEKDVNECSTKTHNCNVNAECNNTEGSFNCSCKVGFNGDGKKCTDVNECATDTHNCGVHAHCNNTEGSFNCSCKEGFNGDGKNCTDIDECISNTHRCHKREICNNTDGSYSCECKSEFNCTFKAVFTNLNTSGRIGPTTLGSHYTGHDHDGQVVLSSGVQQWTVPYIGDYRIEAIAAAGGYDRHTNSTQYRGRGARMTGTFRLNKGEVIQILVGQEGGINTKRFSSGGGGGTFVVREANTPLIIAGGGGGVNRVLSSHEGCDASTNTAGNPGYKSWSGGSNGHGAQTADYDASGGGGGGFYSSGRSGKNFNGTKGFGGEGGKGFMQGGVGGRARFHDVDGGFGGGGGAYGWRGGGGGGGYSGGSSGKGTNDSCGGGGGSYNNGNNQDNECCFNNAGHGQVTITFLK